MIIDDKCDKAFVKYSMIIGDKGDHERSGILEVIFCNIHEIDHRGGSHNIL